MTDLTIATSAELNQWYFEQVGYRPQEEDPDLSTEDLRRLCFEIQDFDRECEEAARA